MMREIKFRAWDDRIGVMLKPLTVQYMAGCMPRLDLDNTRVHLMQYTGLKDKNGKEIYEGDVVRFSTSYEYDNDDYSGEAEVKWVEKEAGFWPFTLNNRWRCDVVNVEVIGNIYENPE